MPDVPIARFHLCRGDVFHPRLGPTCISAFPTLLASVRLRTFPLDGIHSREFYSREFCCAMKRRAASHGKRRITARRILVDDTDDEGESEPKVQEHRHTQLNVALDGRVSANTTYVETNASPRKSQAVLRDDIPRPPSPPFDYARDPDGAEPVFVPHDFMGPGYHFDFDDDFQPSPIKRAPRLPEVSQTHCSVCAGSTKQITL